MNTDKSTLIVIAAIIAVVFFLSQNHDLSFTAASANPETGPYYALQFEDYPRTVSPGENFSYTVQIVNVGQPGFLMVDSGIYSKEVIESWGYPVSSLFAVYPESLAAKNVQKCVPTEKNVQNKLVQLNHNDETTVTFNIIAPSDPCKTYYLHVGSFKRCWGYNDSDSGYLTDKVARNPISLSTKCTTPKTNATTPTTTSSTTSTPSTPGTDYGAQAKQFWDGLGRLGQIGIIALAIILVLVFIVPKEEK